MDIRTLITVLCLESSCLAGVMVLVGLSRKTYPGFGRWTVATVLLALGYLLFVLRGAVPVSVSVIGGNLAFTLAATLIYSGTRSFLGLGEARPGIWLIPLSCLLGASYFLWARDLPTARALVSAVTICAIGLPASRLLFRYAPKGYRTFHYLTGGMFGLICLAMLVRAVTIASPHPAHHLFGNPTVSVVYWFVAILSQLIWTLGFVMLNAQRLEMDLGRTQTSLAANLKNLEHILDFLPDPTWVVGLDGKIKYWNRAVEKLTSRKAADMVGKGNYEYSLPFYGVRRPILVDLVMQRDEAVEKKYLSLENIDGKLVNSESFHPQLSEEGIYLAGSAACLYDDDGRVAGAIETVRDISKAKKEAEEKEKLIAQLQDALDNVKTLKGLIPICANCKSIRRDEGYWQKLEGYMAEHADIQFSHGICPDCAKKLYPGITNDSPTD